MALNSSGCFSVALAALRRLLLQVTILEHRGSLHCSQPSLYQLESWNYKVFLGVQLHTTCRVVPCILCQMCTSGSSYTDVVEWIGVAFHEASW